MPNVKVLALIAVAALITSCGEARFFQDIRLSGQRDFFQLISSTAYELGYTPCPDYEASYCNKSAHYTFEISKNSEADFELTFLSFGVPNRQGNAREELAAALRKNCSECKLYVKDRSIWGFRKEDSGWNPF